MQDNPLLEAKDIAELCSVSPRTVSERWAVNPEFPAPVYMPTGAKGNARKRWRKSDIYKHFGLTEDSRHA